MLLNSHGSTEHVLFSKILVEKIIQQFFISGAKYFQKGSIVSIRSSDHKLSVDRGRFCPDKNSSIVSHGKRKTRLLLCRLSPMF